MTTLLVTIHVLSAILTIGPVTAAASMFPAAARTAALDPTGGTGQLVVLHRICRGYSAVAIAVPAFGIAAAGRLHLWGQAWLIAAVLLTAAAAAVLLGLVLPGQRHILAGVEPASIGAGHAAELPNDASPGTAVPLPSVSRQVTSRLAAVTGGFNLLWLAVAVLMLVRPGSTAGS